MLLSINYQCTASISLPIQRTFCALQIKQNLTKILSVFDYQLSMHCFYWSTYLECPWCFAHKPIPYKNSKFICLSTIDALLRLVYLFSGPFSLYALNQYLTKIVSVFAYQLSMHCFN